jgi:hypothetical protein
LIALFFDIFAMHGRLKMTDDPIDLRRGAEEEKYGREPLLVRCLECDEYYNDDSGNITICQGCGQYICIDCHKKLMGDAVCLDCYDGMSRDIGEGQY